MLLHWKRKIGLVWLGQSVSLLTTSMLQMCLIWYLTQRTGSATIVTVATLAGFLPQAILGPFVGAVIDRFQKKTVIIFADLFIAFASCILAFFASLGELPIPFILLILVFRSLGTAFHEPTAQALTPLLVPKEYLTKYAGFAQAFETASMLLSPSLSVVLYAVWPLEKILFLDVLGALVAVLFLLCVKIPVEERSEKQQKKLNVWQETKEGLGIMKGISGVFSLMFVGFLYTAMYSPIGSLYPLITMVYFGGDTTQSAFVEVIFSCGTMLGALCLGKFGGSFPPYLGLFGSIFLYGLGGFSIGHLPTSGYLFFVIISFFMGTSTPFYYGISHSIYQQTIPAEYLGRAFALAQSARRMGMPLGLLIGGQFADTFGVNVLYRVAGLSAMVLAVVGWLSHKKTGNEHINVS